MSKRPESVAIISMAQQAVPNGIGQRDDLRAQLIIFDSVVVITLSPSPVSSPIDHL
jgi:hypothetical protein